MINLTYENLCKEHLTFYEINEIIALVDRWLIMNLSFEDCRNQNLL